MANYIEELEGNRIRRLAQFEEVVGETFVSVEVTDELVTFETESGFVYEMFHVHECSEVVWLEDFNGDAEDIIGSPIIRAYKNTGKYEPGPDSWDHFGEWTFYHLSTSKGDVTLRWQGESNGCYSVGVDFFKSGARVDLPKRVGEIIDNKLRGGPPQFVRTRVVDGVVFNQRDLRKVSGTRGRLPDMRTLYEWLDLFLQLEGSDVSRHLLKTSLDMLEEKAHRDKHRERIRTFRKEVVSDIFENLT